MYPTRLYLFWNTIPSLKIPSCCGCNIAEFDSYSCTRHNRLNTNLTFKTFQNAQIAQNTFSTFCWCSALTSGCSFISQQIWNKIFIMLTIGICIKIEKLSLGKGSMYRHISGWQTFDFGTCSPLIITRWQRCRSGWMWCRVWSRCPCDFAHPACLWILRCAIWARKAAIRLIFLNNCQVSFYHSLYLFMPRKLNSPLLLFSDLGTRFLAKVLRFLYWGIWKPSFGYFGHIQGKAHVRLF